MERSITYLRASTNICCVKSTAAQQGERGQAQRSPLESMVRRGDKQMCEAAEGVKRHLVERLSGHPAACTALPCAIPGQPPSARAGDGFPSPRNGAYREPPQWGLSLDSVSAVNTKVFSYPFHDVLPRLRAMKIQRCHRALGWRTGEYLV